MTGVAIENHMRAAIWLTYTALGRAHRQAGR